MSIKIVLVDPKQPMPDFGKYKLILCKKCGAIKPDIWFRLHEEVCSKCVRRSK